MKANFIAPFFYSTLDNIFFAECHCIDVIKEFERVAHAQGA
jgi:hypothetical protein